MFSRELWFCMIVVALVVLGAVVAVLSGSSAPDAGDWSEEGED